MLFVLRYVVLEYFPKLIINGYFSIFLCFFVATILFTKNKLFSILIGLLVINLRIIYRSVKDKNTLNEYNSFSNCLIFGFALLVLSIIFIHYDTIDKLFNKYYINSIVLLILLNLYSLKINKTDNQLLCFS